MRRWVLLLVLASCDGTFGLTRVKLPVDAPTTSDRDGGEIDAPPGIGDDAMGSDAISPENCTVDTFVQLDEAEWSEYLLGDSSVAVTGGELLLRTATNTTGASGVRGAQRDYRGKSIGITIRQYIATNADNILALTVTSNANYRMFANQTSLTMQQVVGGVAQDSMSIVYSISTHRHWRIAHDLANGRVAFFTNDDVMSGWTLRHTVPATSSVLTARAEISAVLYASSPVPRDARFDDFKICTP